MEEPGSGGEGRATPDGGRPLGALDRYVPGIDGLRAVAVGWVVAYHLGASWATGGFLGVSQFFTLSGFLITSMLLRSHDLEGGPRLRTFWGRRYRRLLPAAYLTLGAVAVVGVVAPSAEQVEDLGAAVAACVAQVANWFFIVAGQSYVDLFSDPSPVQHFWSLAIEEQLYLLLPVGLALLLRRTRSPAALGGALGALAVGSAGLMLVLFESGASIDRLYYGTDTRAAELLTGSVLAIVAWSRPLPSGVVGRRVLGVAGVLALGAATWVLATASLADAWLYRGGFAAFSLLSVVVVASVAAGTPLAAVLGWRPLAAVGRISYGIYLFHWPLFLWLDEARTGLDGPALVTVRLGATLAAAVASYHLVEMPIRNGSLQRLRFRPALLVPVLAVVLVGTAVVATDRDGPDDLAGLGEEASAMPTAPDDGVLDVVVVADDTGDELVAELVAAADERPDLAVTVGSPFGCEPAGEAVPATCAGWDETWSDLVATAEPDVVLFHVTRWEPDQLAPLAGTRDREGQRAWVADVLARGFDVLTADGAVVVWNSSPVDIAEGIRRDRDPFYRTMQQLVAERRDVRTPAFPRTDLEDLLDDLALYRGRAGGGGGPRVLVVGDSVSITVGYGLERWGVETGSAVVWSAGTQGCGVADEGTVVDATGREVEPPERCRDVTATWAEQVTEFAPDLVIVLSTAVDAQDRRVDPGGPLVGPGDAAFDDYLVGEYETAVDVLSAGGARVLWLTMPCARDLIGLGGDALGEGLDPERVAHVNDVLLPRVAAERPAMRTFDLFAVLCPGGEFTDQLGDVGVARPDGIHLSPAGSMELATTHGAAMLEAGLAS